jgi:hypothetical protein
MSDENAMRTTLTYDWEGMRDWCIWCLDVFLKWAPKLGSKDTYRQYFRELGLRPVSWSKVRRIGDDRVGNVVHTVAALVGEAAPTKSALPGDFRRSVVMAERLRSVLLDHEGLDDVATAFARIEAES